MLLGQAPLGPAIGDSRALMPDVTFMLSAAPSPKFNVVRWYGTEDGLVMVFTEFIKLGYYWLHHGIAPFAW